MCNTNGMANFDLLTRMNDGEGYYLGYVSLYGLDRYMNKIISYVRI